MAKILQLRDPGGRLINISGPTQLGRTPDLRWATERNMPPEFSQLELLVQVDNGSEFVSRNHAAIIPDITQDNYRIVDLNSLNGTTVVSGKKKHRLSGGNSIGLDVDDKIYLGPEFSLVVAGLRGVGANNYAVLAGHPGDDLFEGVRNDLRFLVHELERRNYGGRITQLFDSRANKKNILDALRSLSALATSDSHIIFYYGGHGSRQGLALGNETLKPHELFDAVAGLRGKKALLLDACFAGQFANSAKYAIPPNTVVIGATREHDFGWVRHATLAGGQMSAFTRDIVKYFRENTGLLDLVSLRDYFQERLGRGELKIDGWQHPVFHGTSFTMPPRVHTGLGPLEKTVFK